jgi:uncharacterized protein YecE (DUF72 family)
VSRSRASGRLFVGTSGYVYPHWRRRFYPMDVRAPDWLRYYAGHFSTVELNNPFYRLPSGATFARWRQQVPAGFLFAVKASRYLTHLKRLRDPEDGIRLLFERATRLRKKLGPVLFQLPPRFPLDLPRFRTFLEAVPAGVRAAWEFRDDSWLTDDVLSALDAAGHAFVLADRPGFRGPVPVTGGWSYVRFHQGTRSGSDYRRDKLHRWAERIATREARDVWAFFNNDHGGAAVRDARFLRELLLPASRVA